MNQNNSSVGTASMIVLNNNTGASRINTGDFKGAIGSLSIALKAAKSIMSQEGDCEKCGRSQSFDLDLLMSQQCPMSKYGGSAASWSPLRYPIYNKPICLPQSFFAGTDSSRLGFDSEIVFSVVSIFNLALAHHMIAFDDRNPISSGIFLKKAIKLYEFAIQVHQQENRTDEGAPCTLFYLATLNNLADAHREIGESENSKTYFQQVLSILMYLTDTQQASSSHIDLDMFFRNTFIFLVSDQQENAAAA